MNYIPKPIGSRVIVRDITPVETKTKGGIIVPEYKAVSGEEDLGMVKKSPALRIVEVLAVGEGRADPATGKYLAGSRVVVGGKYLMRAGAMSQNHMDSLPGRPDEFVVLEDTLVCAVEFSTVEAEAPRRLVAVP